MARKKQQIISVILPVSYDEIYAAIEATGHIATVARVVEVVRYLETTARDAAASALVDWQEQIKQDDK